MEKISNCNIKRNKKLLVSDIIKYYETRGYTLIDADAYGMTLKKGSRWGSISSPNPLNWRTTVKLDIVKVERMDYNLFARYKFSSLGQFLSTNTKIYFQKETEAFNEAMLHFKVNTDEIEKIGNEASTENIQNMFSALAVGVLVAILLIFGLKIYLTHDLSVMTCSALTLLSIIFCYYIINQVRHKTNTI
ncbi:hypothetical protein [Ancylomarina sp. 16SWW S1-10-2]|uniref:hypothetical protein n=1 Tax=Ancylomarina sp. 16SWW S1-10-2 TaxID=2499681 RepID=UPI0012ADF161|nr:hypothetical protein [Ancylomarina sp. 16SWW S1-10-2]MRT93400.1 hypothetical protein [Ancylomarina sp. 16SWW S1-10-2]